MARRGETWEEEADSQEVTGGIVEGGGGEGTSAETAVAEVESQTTAGGRRKSARVRR